MLSLFSYHVKHVNELLVNVPRGFKVTPLLFNENELLFHIEVYFENKKLVRELHHENYSFVIKQSLFEDDNLLNKTSNKITLKEGESSKELTINHLISDFLSTNIIDTVLEGESMELLKELTQYEITHDLVRRNANTSLFVTSLIHYQINSINYLIYQFGEYYSIIKSGLNKNGDISVIKDNTFDTVIKPVNDKFNLLNSNEKSFSDLILRIVSEYDLEDLSESVLIDKRYVPVFSV